MDWFLYDNGFRHERVNSTNLAQIWDNREHSQLCIRAVFTHHRHFTEIHSRNVLELLAFLMF